MFGMMKNEMARIGAIIKYGAGTAMSRLQFFELEIANWKKSPERKAMIMGERYYRGEHDILNRKRTIIGPDGLLAEVENLPNNRVVDNQYSKMVDQKKNYLLGQALTFDTKNTQYEEALKRVFNRTFQRTFKNLGEDSLNGAIAWLHPYYSETGELLFKRFAPYEVKPFWKDSEHTILDCALRLYEVEAYEGRVLKTIEKVEIYSETGVERYVLMNGTLLPDNENPSANYIKLVDADGKETEYNWGRIPLIPFKYNNKEIPLIMRCKSLQDGINTMLSDFENNMQEDARNTILILKNYDGQNLGEFRRNLAAFGAVKVREDGDVTTLTVEIDAENYKAILELFKKALIENCRGYDAKDDRMAGNPNQMNIQSMYSDIDLDANEMETEYQASFEQLLWFVNCHLANTGQGNFDGVEVTVIFNRDILINESESIENCGKSTGILSTETIVANHPWTTDVQKELERLKAEQQEAIDEFMNGFNPVDPNNKAGGNGPVQE